MLVVFCDWFCVCIIWLKYFQGDFMDCLFEFVVNYYILVLLFVVFLLVILVLEFCCGGVKILVQGVVSLINKDEVVVVDIWDCKDFGEGCIIGLVNIFLNSFKSCVVELNKFKEKQIIVVDKMGQYLVMVVKQFNVEGFVNVLCLNGGIVDWKVSNLLLVKK